MRALLRNLRALFGALGILLDGWTTISCGARSDLSQYEGCLWIGSATIIETAQVSWETCSPVNPPTSYSNAGALDIKYATEYQHDFRLVYANGYCFSPSRLHLKAAEVELQSKDGTPIVRDDGTPVKFSQPLSGVVETFYDTPPLVDARVTLIDAATMPTIANMAKLLQPGEQLFLIASVTTKATDDDGQRSTSDPYLFPIFVCNGCLCDETTCGLPGTPAPDCRIGQDHSFDCRLRKTGCD
jgi:hypothetical protein